MVTRFIPRALATSSGLCPSWTLFTARFLSSVRVLWSRFLASAFFFMRKTIPQMHDYVNTIMRRLIYTLIDLLMKDKDFKITSEYELALDRALTLFDRIDNYYKQNLIDNETLSSIAAEILA